MRRRRFLKRDSGIAFTDESNSQMTAAQINPSYGKTVSGEYADTVKWGTTGNVYTCIIDQEDHDAITNYNSRTLIAEVNGEKYIIGCSAGNIVTKKYRAGDAIDDHYKWTRRNKSGSSSNFDIVNNATGDYAYVDNKGQLKAQSTQPSAYFNITSGALLSYAYKTGADWYMFKYSTSSIRIKQSSISTAKIYSCTYNDQTNRTFTLTPVKEENGENEEDGTLTGSKRVLVIKDSSGNRVIVGMDTGGSITTVAKTMKNANNQSGNAASDDDVLTFNDSNSLTSYWPRFWATVSGSNGSYQLCYQYNTYTRYLTAPTGNLVENSSSFAFKMKSTQSSVSYNDEYGVYIPGILVASPFGITSINKGFTTSNYTGDLSAGGATVLFQWNGSSWSPYYGQLQTGGQYAVVIKGTGNWCVMRTIYNRTWADTGHTYFADGAITSGNETIVSGVTTSARGTGYDLMKNGKYLVYNGSGFSEEDTQPSTYFTIVDGELVLNYSTTVSDTTTWNTKTFGVTTAAWEFTCNEYAMLAECVITNDCAFTATQGSNGFTLMQGSNGVNVNNNQLALLAVSLEWAYIPNSTTPESSRLWSVSSSTVTYYPEYANGDLEANTTVTDTIASCYLVQNGKVQTYVDELVDGETYVVVFKSGDNHYAACVSGTDIVPVLFRDKLPQRLPAEYRFVAQSSGDGFYFLNGQNKLGIATNTKLSVGEYNAIWHYTIPEDTET